MNPRLTRPLLAAAISGALVAGGGFAGGPAFARPDTPRTGIASPAGPAADPAARSGSTTAPEPTALPDPSPAAATTAPAATTPPATAAASPPQPRAGSAMDSVAPVGTFTLDATAIWIGQSVTLTQGAVTDDTSAPAEISRVVDWGDGTSSTLAAGTAKYPHTYATNGTFTVAVTFQDAAGNSSRATSAVTVTTPGKVKLSKTAVWNGEHLHVTFSSVPAATTKISLDWGDGYISDHPGKNQAVRGLYYAHKKGGLVTGDVTLYATYTNKLGASSAIRIGKVTVKKDKTKPVVTIKKPGSPNRLKSWKTLRGTVTDKGATSPYVYVWAVRVTGSKTYCYTAKKTWKRFYGTDGYDKYCGSSPVEVQIRAGKWSMKLSGLKKGTLYVDARAWDWADNASKWAQVKSKITRS